MHRPGLDLSFISLFFYYFLSLSLSLSVPFGRHSKRSNHGRRRFPWSVLDDDGDDVDVGADQHPFRPVLHPHRSGHHQSGRHGTATLFRRSLISGHSSTVSRLVATVGEHHRLHLHHGVAKQLALEGQLVQFLFHGRLLDHGHPAGLLPLPHHRETLLHPLGHGGTRHFRFF